MPKNYGNKFIGIFDSGFGGLSILRSIVKELPQYNYLYLGDSARVPYGNRSPELVYQFTKQAVDFLFKKNCNLIILACNTASSGALRRIQQEHLPKYYPEKKVLGVLIPAAELAVVRTRNKRIGVMATKGTVRSKAFVREITKLSLRALVFQKACPLLVPLVEAGKINSVAMKFVLKTYLELLLKKDIDTLILGCTHYGILEKQIKKIIGREINLIAEEKIVPEKLKSYLKKHKDLEKKLGRNGTIDFYCTGDVNKFQTIGSKFFGKKIRAQSPTLG